MKEAQSVKPNSDSQVQVSDICQWIQELADPSKRENALLQLRFIFKYIFSVKQYNNFYLYYK